MRILLLAVALALAACATTPPRLNPTQAAEIDAILAEQQQDQHIPGLAMLIVQDGEIVYTRTLGQRDIEHDLPVTLDTAFPIGSATKSFTSMLVALAQDDGLLTLGDHPRRYLPYFQMRDAQADATITLRDLLSHQTGLRAYADLAAEPGVLTREEYLRATIGAEPAFPPRTQFQYSNAMITAAGEAAAHANGLSWEALVEQRIFVPLGMTNSIANIITETPAADHAVGYVYDASTETYAPIAPPASLAALAPAGAISASANDMAQWLLMLTAGGVHNGERFVSEAMLAELTRPHIAINDHLSYALGWATYDWNGLDVVEHNGGSRGISALVSYIPERRTGFVFLANTSPNAMTRITAAGDLIYPILFGVPAAAPAASAAPTPPAAAAEPHRAETPSIDTLLPRMVRAAGGAAALRRHRCLTLEGTKSYDHQGIAGPFVLQSCAPASFDARETWFAADREISRVRIYFDGAHGGQETTFGQDEINDEDANARWRRLYDFRQLLSLREIYPEIATANAEIDGAPVYAITLGADGETLETWLVARDSGRIIRRVTATSTTDYDDFRSIDGEIIPHRFTTQDALGKTTSIVESARFNAPMPPGTFAPQR